MAHSYYPAFVYVSFGMKAIILFHLHKNLVKEREQINWKKLRTAFKCKSPSFGNEKYSLGKYLFKVTN